MRRREVALPWLMLTRDVEEACPVASAADGGAGGLLDCWWRAGVVVETAAATAAAPWASSSFPGVPNA